MSHAHASHPGQTNSAETLPFSSAEIEAFHEQDRKAATAIVGLMGGIFVLGVLGYLLVCYSVS